VEVFEFILLPLLFGDGGDIGDGVGVGVGVGEKKVTSCKDRLCG
jgi:hypothetical protein